MYELALFGGLALEGPKGPLSGHATQSRQMALLALLGTAGNAGLSRDKLLAHLFPESSEASARHSLTDAVYRLRKALGREAVLGGAATLSLNPELIRCDVQAFEAALAEGEPEKAAELYRGPFLDGFHLRESNAFEQWKDVEARRLASMYEGALETLATRAESAGDSVEAVRWWGRLVESDPLNSRNAARLIEAQAEAGDPANAILYAEQHADLLRRELGVEPPDELRDLVERIRGTVSSSDADGGPHRTPRAPRFRFPSPLGRRRGRSEASTLSKRKRQNVLRRYLVLVPSAVAAIGAAVWLGTRGNPEQEDTADSGSAEAGAAVSAEEADRLVVVPSGNHSGEPDLEVWGKYAAREMSRAIDRTGIIVVVPDDAMGAARHALGADASAVSVATRLKASYVFAVTFGHTGEDVRFLAELLHVRGGDTLVATLKPVGGPIDSMQTVVSRLADAAAAAVMAQLGSGGVGWMREMSLPPRPDVYQDYLRSWSLFGQRRWGEAIEAGNRVLAKDPDYVSALLLNNWSYQNSGRNEEADSVLRELQALRDRMTPTERNNVDYAEAYLHGRAHDAWVAAEKEYRRAPTYGSFSYNAGVEAWKQGRLEDAIERFMAVDPDVRGSRDWVYHWTAPAGVYHLLRRYEEELAWVRKGLERLPDNPMLMELEAGSFAAMDSLESVDSVLDLMATLPPSGEDLGYYTVLVALELRAHHHPEAADSAFARALAGYAAEDPGKYRANRGRAFYYSGHLTEADTLFRALVEEAPNSIALRGYRGAALARLDRRDEALQIDQWLKDVPERPGLRGTNLWWRAVIHAALGDRKRAVGFMKEAFDHGSGYGGYLAHQEPAFDDMWGYPPWDRLMAPR